MLRSGLVVGLLMAAVLLAGCQSGAPSPTATAVPSPTVPSAAEKVGDVPKTAHEVPRITPQELKSVMDAGHPLILVDTRNRESYERGHLPGAGAMTLAEVETRHRELPRGAKIVFYCA